MSTILAGNFETVAHAGDALRALAAAGIAADRICSYRINPPGQHAAYPIGGDEYASEGATEGGGGALKGAAIGGAIGLGAGIAALPIAGPAALAGGAGIGAYVGSLAGALSNMGEDEKDRKAGASPEAPHDRPAGVLVAVLVPEEQERKPVADILQANGARDVEEAEGTWQDGGWVDFDPTRPTPPAGTGEIARA